MLCSATASRQARLLGPARSPAFAQLAELEFWQSKGIGVG